MLEQHLNEVDLAIVSSLGDLILFYIPYLGEGFSERQYGYHRPFASPHKS